MTAEKAFQLYFAIRLHFNTAAYDVFERGTNFTGKNELSDRNDFKLIIPLMKFAPSEREFIELCVANNLYGNPEFLYEPEYADENYKHWRKVKESIDYTLEKDLDHIEFWCFQKKRDLDSYMGNYVIQDLLNREVQFESIILLDRASGCISHIAGFDASKYRDRMVKASRFVTKGTLGLRHKSRIDNFLTFVTKGSHNGNNTI